MSYKELSLTQIAKKIKKGEVSCLDVVTESLNICKSLKEYNAFISLFEEESLRLARAYDEMAKCGYFLGPLHGVPVVIKDNIAMAGTITTAGSKLLGENLTEEDSTVVKNLKGAGAIIIGKTNMHEFAWGGSTSNEHYGYAHNPWDFTKNPSGSSGGTGIAIAARAAFGGVGTDTGGSVRLPSSVNGITGIRPTIGRVSNYGVVPLAYSLDTVGPMCRTVEDCAVMLGVMAGHDYHDLNSALKPVEDYTKDLNKGVKDIRIGVIKDYCFHCNQPDVEKCYAQALEKFRELGAVVKEVEIPNLDTLIGGVMVIDAVEPSAYHMGWLRECPEKYAEEIRIELEAGCMIAGTQYYQALAYRTLIKAELEEAFKDVDVIITPTVPYTALSIENPVVEFTPGVREDPLHANLHYTAIPSITGKPALDIPAGFDVAGMPIGIMIIADSFKESMCFRVGNAFQQATDYHKRAPKLDHAAPAES